MYHPLTAKKHAETEQNILGAKAAELTLEERIAALDKQIRKDQSWAEYYTRAKNPKVRNPKLAQLHLETADRLALKREFLLAQLYASQMPDIGGAFVLYPDGPRVGKK